jgi:hypothetical protein
MTFAELIVLVIAGTIFYLLLKPLRERIEARLYRFFRSKTSKTKKTVIDITDYSKKKGPDHEV